MKQMQMLQNIGYLLIFVVNIPLYGQNVIPQPGIAMPGLQQLPGQNSAPIPSDAIKAPVAPQQSLSAPLQPQVHEQNPLAQQKAAETKSGQLSTPKEPVKQSEKSAGQLAPAVLKGQEQKEMMPKAPDQPVLKEDHQDVPEKKPEKQSTVFEEEGIDTFEQDGGNWLLKRQALEKTMDVIEKIKDVFTKILDSRIDYLIKRNKIDRTFDTFSNTIGFELGDLNQLLSAVSNDLKSQRAKEGDLPEEERTLLQEIENKITEVKSLRTTVKAIAEMDGSLDETIMQLEKEINTSNSYQTRAWRNFQTIKKVLSDEKAEELYLQTESLLKNMQDIEKYLKGELASYFNSVIDNLKQEMNKAENAIKELESKGINLKDEVKRIHKAEKLARKKKRQKIEDEKKQQEEKKAPEKISQPKEVKKGWIESLSVIWQYPLNLLTSAWDYITGLFGSKKITIIEPAERIKVQETAKVEEKLKTK